jgi:hypothetical protein
MFRELGNDTKRFRRGREDLSSAPILMAAPPFDRALMAFTSARGQADAA